MYTTILVGGIVLIVMLLGLAFWCVYRAGREDGYEARIADEAQQRADERTAARKTEWKAPRHALTAPRREPDKTSLVRSDEPITWERDEAVGGPVELPGKWYADRIAASMAARRAAVDVILPEPGSYLPQAGRTTAPGTITFPAVQLDTASTGEIRGLGDAMVAAIEAAGLT